MLGEIGPVACAHLVSPNVCCLKVYFALFKEALGIITPLHSV